MDSTTIGDLEFNSRHAMKSSLKSLLQFEAEACGCSSTLPRADKQSKQTHLSEGSANPLHKQHFTMQVIVGLVFLEH